MSEENTTNNQDQSDEFLQKLKVKLFRFDCPDTLQLGDYQAGLLSELEADPINFHLEDCRLCRIELSKLDLIGEHAEDQTILTPEDRPKRTVFFPILMPDTAQTQSAVRGDNDRVSKKLLFKSFVGSQELMLFVNRRKTEEGFLLNGQFAIDESNSVLLEGCRIEIWHQEKMTATALIDDLGTFVCRLENDSPFLFRVLKQDEVMLFERVKF